MAAASPAVPRFLADESCDFAVVRGLRSAGFDVVAVGEKAPGSSDERVIELARSESRVVLTEDRDFGRLVFAATRATSGVIFIRYPATRRAELTARVLDLAQRQGDRLEESFTVVGPGRTRIRKLPG
jgi:predicted nuclease of predicted toxin-antitoxin system